MRVRRVVTGLVPCLLALVVAVERAHAQDYKQFFGEYVGEAVSGEGAKIEKRDIRAKIAQANKGFSVNWVMTIHRTSGKEKHVEYTMTFQPTARKNVFSANMSFDAFGNAVPLDPMKGDPYVWARVEGQTLSLYAMTVTEAGGYEMQVYDRKLVPGGMDLKYSRVLDGQVQRTITGKLKKVK
jgi:hypothetical protein